MDGRYDRNTDTRCDRESHIIEHGRQEYGGDRIDKYKYGVGRYHAYDQVEDPVSDTHDMLDVRRFGIELIDDPACDHRSQIEDLNRQEFVHSRLALGELDDVSDSDYRREYREKNDRGSVCSVFV